MKCTRILLCSALLLGSIFIMQSCTTETKANKASETGLITTNLVSKKNIANIANAGKTKTSQALKWYSINEVEQLQAKTPKKVIIDVYTNWCRWCKVMDQKTFTNPALIDYLNENYYMVKFNAEQKEVATFKGKKYEFHSNGLKGFNTLAAELTQGKLSYPSFVVLDEKLNTLKVTRGFKDAPQFKLALESIKSI